MQGDQASRAQPYVVLHLLQAGWPSQESPPRVVLRLGTGAQIGGVAQRTGAEGQRGRAKREKDREGGRHPTRLQAGDMLRRLPKDTQNLLHVRPLLLALDTRHGREG